MVGTVLSKTKLRPGYKRRHLEILTGSTFGSDIDDVILQTAPAQQVLNTIATFFGGLRLGGILYLVQEILSCSPELCGCKITKNS